MLANLLVERVTVAYALRVLGIHRLHLRDRASTSAVSSATFAEVAAWSWSSSAIRLASATRRRVRSSVANLSVALRLRRLPLQRPHLLGDLVEDVVDPGQVLPRRLKPQLGQALLRLENA